MSNQLRFKKVSKAVKISNMKKLLGTYQNPCSWPFPGVSVVSTVEFLYFSFAILWICSFFMATEKIKKRKIIRVRKYQKRSRKMIWKPAKCISWNSQLRYFHRHIMEIDDRSKLTRKPKLTTYEMSVKQCRKI